MSAGAVQNYFASKPVSFRWAFVRINKFTGRELSKFIDNKSVNRSSLPSDKKTCHIRRRTIELLVPERVIKLLVHHLRIFYSVL
jgi:hypothetical protein